jgi:hypothetical protein
MAVITATVANNTTMRFFRRNLLYLEKGLVSPSS